VGWQRGITKSDLDEFEDRLSRHIDERLTAMTDAFSQSLADLDAEITAVVTEFQTLISQVAAGTITVQAAHDQVEQRVDAIKAAVAGAQNPVPAPTPPPAG
jgi:hypothetical protein